MNKRILQQVRQHLSHPLCVTQQGNASWNLRNDGSPRMHISQFVDGLIENPLEIGFVAQVQRYSAAHSSAHKVRNVIDQRGDSFATAAHRLK